MPFISTKTNVTITPEKEVMLKERFGRAMAIIGKGEGWLMLSFEGDKNMWFKGRNDMNIAMLELSLFGKATENAYERMTAELCDAVNEILGVSKDCIYVKYQEVSTWGWNSQNF